MKNELKVLMDKIRTLGVNKRCEEKPHKFINDNWSVSFRFDPSLSPYFEDDIAVQPVVYIFYKDISIAFWGATSNEDAKHMVELYNELKKNAHHTESEERDARVKTGKELLL